jgi:hypothetical protein
LPALELGEGENDLQQEETSISMLTEIMQYVSTVTLILGFFWNLPVGHQEWSMGRGGYFSLFNILLCLIALLVVTEAVRASKYSWAAAYPR